MFYKSRDIQWPKYNKAREFLIGRNDILIKLEEYLAKTVTAILQENFAEIENDYNEASFLYPFWSKYPPDERGRQPIGDQFPWIEVGEHVFGAKLPRLLLKKFTVYDPGLPTGSDERFLLESDEIEEITEGLTRFAWLFVDIKSVGPRDNFEHVVMSHNQISGDGIWTDKNDGIHNTPAKATGKKSSHSFHCTLPPLYVLSSGIIAPTVTLVIKPLYKMLSLERPEERGQPLGATKIVTIPNGILLCINPAYLQQYPGLLFPGKDDKDKNPLKVRARVSFDILRKIADWRILTLSSQK